MKRLAAALAVVLGVALLGAPPIAVADERDRVPTIDPSKMGPYPVDEIDYHGGHVILADPSGAPVIEELKGTIYLPEGAKGPHPLLVFIHGRHASCRILSQEILI